MSDSENISLIFGCASIILNKLKKKKRRSPRWWCTELYKKRTGSALLTTLKFQHISGHYKNFTRMSPTDFENLLLKIGSKISKKKTYFRNPISVQDR